MGFQGVSFTPSVEVPGCAALLGVLEVGGPVVVALADVERQIRWFVVWGLGFGFWGLGFEVWALGVGVWGLDVGAWGLKFGVEGSGFRV